MKKCAAVTFILAAVVSCGPRYVYPHLEWLIPWYISDYISLDDRQKNLLEERLLKQLDWHCRTQLRTYAGVLRAIGLDFSSATQPIEYSKIQSYNQRLMTLWKDLLRQIRPDITDILLTASNTQIAELFGNLQKRNQIFKEKYVDLQPRELNENRQKRMIKRLEYWISDVTEAQQAAVSAWSSQLVPIAGDWLKNRELIQAEARRLLIRAKIDPEFRITLQELIINPERMRSSNYQQKIDINTDITIRLVMQLDHLATPQQRTYLTKRIESLAADFDKLSCDPKDKPNSGSEFRVLGSKFHKTPQPSTHSN
ncbi:MAG: hypothetical protein JSW26_17015 [Desulfobacterales bacterium]|nr:MAG: hypothetical protein JSW26_17015 [Desulfobacterales bacterium]